MTVDVTELRRLHDAATLGPWMVADRGSIIDIETAGSHVAEIDTSYDDYFDRERCEADAALIVAAVNALPALLDRLDAYQEAVRLLRGEAVLEQDAFDENVAVRIPIGPWRAFSAALDTEQT